MRPATIPAARPPHPFPRRRSAWLRFAAALLALLLPAACTRTERTPPGGPGPGEGESHPTVGTAAPSFAAQDPSGPWLPIGSLRGKSVALLFFRPGAPASGELARAWSEFRGRTDLAPTVFLGLARDSIERIREFAGTERVDLPLLRDPGSVARAFGVGDLPTVVLLDTEHIVRYRLDGFLGASLQPRLRATAEFLLRLPTLAAAPPAPLDLAYSENPRAPLWSGRALDGRRVELAALRGRVVVLTFFDQECPHCQRDLPRLVPVLREFRRRGVAAVGVVSRDAGGRLAEFLRAHGVDFPVIIDGERAIFGKYESTRTPDTFLIDKDGFIRFRERGDRPDRAALTRLQLRLLLGGETPSAIAASLPRDRYAGDAACRACHAREYRDWLYSPHSLAWDTLQKGDKWRDPECVPCHVTGAGRPGGFTDPAATPHLVDVQCEVCHGPGGGHPAGAPPADLPGTCATCHTGKFVLNFDPDEALALMVHQDRPDAGARFRDEEKRRRIEAINTRRLETFRSGVAYVGADACKECHAREYEQWSRTPHATAYATLVAGGRASDSTCLPCHTTGWGRKGGFGEAPALTTERRNPMTGVQCEVCHGPGDDHVRATDERRKETIYGITDQCSFCIIQGVCATCHDARNDPDFDIEAALPPVRHAPGG